MADSPAPADAQMLASVQAALGAGFTVERELGGGGMSRVYVAMETALARRVAVKVLSPELSEGVSAERFSREVSLAATLQAPHIVPVLATGQTAQGLPWYTMPFIEGESLRARLERGSVPLDEALRILRDVAEALEYAHARSIVHRDIKPENVLLTGRSAMVTDFGIAKAVSTARDASSKGTLTSVGLSLGTPAYMAPEQVAADAIDHRADLYAWGMVAYELLSGSHPFASRTQAQLMAAQLSELPPALDTLGLGLPPAVTELVMRCLAKLPSERPADATTLLNALGGLGSSSGSVPAARRSDTTRSGTRTSLIAAAVLALVAAALWAGTSGALGGLGIGGAPEQPSLAVLPFEHQGDSADIYLTEGITDEIRTKLAGVRDLVVIARASSIAFRGSGKTPQEIAKDLGVRWLLTGTVRVTGSGSERRVIVRPELVEVTKDGQPQSRWGQPFDAAGNDVLRLQGDVATRVVSAMEVPGIAGADQARLRTLATRDPVAHDLFLRARAATAYGANATPTAFLAAERLLIEAIERDSLYVEAWAALAVTRSNLFRLRPSEAVAEAARTAAERALALDPTGATGAKAMGVYLRNVEADQTSALAQLERSFRADSSDVAVTNNLALAFLDAGRIEEASALFDRAARLDPRNFNVLAQRLLLRVWTDRTDEVQPLMDRMQELVPRTVGLYQRRVLLAVWLGDTATARQTVAEALDVVPKDVFLEFLINFGNSWLAEPAIIEEYLGRDYDAFPGEARYRVMLWRADWAMLNGDTARERLWGDSARRVLAREVATLPDNRTLRYEYAQALNHSGRDAEAMREVREMLRLGEREGNAPHSLARASALEAAVGMAAASGEVEVALDWLEESRKIKVRLPSDYYRVNPYFAALRGNARFERILAGQ